VDGDPSELRRRALDLAETIEPRSDHSDLEHALTQFGLSHDPESFAHISPMVEFLARLLFHRASKVGAGTRGIKKRILDYDGPLFFFVGHTSHYDYMLMAHEAYGLGLAPPIMHVTGSMLKGWLSRWLRGFRYLSYPKSPSAVQHRAYAWFSAALAELRPYQAQVIFARTSRYTVRAREGILREPYAPHAIIASVKAVGKALVVPVAISYSIIPEDRYLAGSALFQTLQLLPKSPGALLSPIMGLKRTDTFFSEMEGRFEDVSVDFGDPFELFNDRSLTRERISHRAMEAVARRKIIHPSHIVARAMQGALYVDKRTLIERVEREVDDIRAFFSAKYRQEPPFHHLIVTDLPEAAHRGAMTLMRRGALRRSFLRRSYVPKNAIILQYYAYQGDRRVYPLSGRNSLAVVNAGVWGYTLALHIGMNLLRKPELAEHSLALYDSREDLIEKLTVEGRHPWHFKDVPLPRSVRPEADLIAAIGDTSLILLVTPSKYFHSTAQKVIKAAPDGATLVIATKGFIPETGLLPCQTIHELAEHAGKRINVAALSGANLAHEIVAGGAGVTQIACEDYAVFERLRLLIETPRFRVVYCDDIIGTTISAALKNVYAIGYGILDGTKNVPENFMATYSTLVTAEIRQFGLLLGASPDTFDSESQVWIADLLATCRGGRSSGFGRDLAGMDEKHGKSMTARLLLEQYRKKKVAVEGFEACRLAQRIASQRGFHPPILGEIYAILHGGKRIDIDAFIEKCLDALSHKSANPTTSRLPHRRKGSS
jgi:glycerol-3-phosphate dehydrogenase (NAD(P)+)